MRGAFWLEGAGCIFAEMQVMRWMVGLTGLPDGAFGVFTSGGTEANLSAMVTRAKRGARGWRAHMRSLVIAADSAHSSIHAMAKVIDVDVRFVPVDDRFEAAHVEPRSPALAPEDARARSR
ncbi:MAG: pyridoxal-dependent decarboxylase [Vicinamibacterales bacterium]